MAAPKIIPYDVELRSVNPVRSFDRPKAYTNDLNSVEFQFKILDMTSTELTTATAVTLVYMRDGSFFANPSTDVSRVENVFSYLLKENEGNHAGVAQIQLVVTVDGMELASQLFEFEIINGLETKVAQEVMIYDWTTLTRDARAYIDQFVADEVFRDAQFDNAQFDRNVAFVATQEQRASDFTAAQDSRTATFNASETSRTQTFNASEAAREQEFDLAEAGRAAGYTADHNRAETDHIIAVDDSEQAATDHTTAAYDHTLAGIDHTRAEADHTRADADSATVAGFNTRLTAEETATANNKVSAVKGKTFADVDARLEDVETDTTLMGTNLVTNGDFSNGTTGWLIGYGTNVVVDNVLKLTGDGVNALVSAYFDTQQPLTIGNKYYFATMARFTSANVPVLLTTFRGTVSGNVEGVKILNPTLNVWNLLSSITKADASFSGNVRVRINATYSDGASSAGQTTEYKYFKCIDLTATFGAGNEPTVEQMDAIMAKFPNSWFAGTKNLFRANATLNKLMAVDARTEFEAKNLVVNGDASNGTTGWVTRVSNFDVVSGKLRYSPTADGRTNNGIGFVVNIFAGRMYYMKATHKQSVPGTTNTTVSIRETPVLTSDQKYIIKTLTNDTTEQKFTSYFTSPVNGGSVLFLNYIQTAVDYGEIDDVLLIDLTATFGAGKEPTLAEMDRLMARFPNGWFDGVKPIQTIETLYQEKANKVQEAWITPTLINGWTGNLQYRKNEFENVEFRGGVTGGMVGTPITTIPAGYRPAINYLFMAMNGYNNTYATGYVTTAGNLQLNTKPSTADPVTMSNCFYSIA